MVYGVKCNDTVVTWFKDGRITLTHKDDVRKDVPFQLLYFRTTRPIAESGLMVGFDSLANDAEQPMQEVRIREFESHTGVYAVFSTTVVCTLPVFIARVHQSHMVTKNGDDRPGC